ncbi:unnamed protein product [Cladocopium goreaui]|uniref:Catechol O-methyltransferase n=1 Tax=Cladocopium goreaui TaxID=2562237 RepID=A0A9P1FYR1_9DINO|nr:unnamed protein product [Cladocopium goreaui]
MKEVGLQPSVYSSSALVQALGRARQWQRALQIFEDSLEQVDADCALYSSAMKACDMDYDRVLTLMDDMVASGIKPDLQSYGIAIGSCCSSQQWQEALDLLLRAEEEDLEPNAKTVSLVMKTMTGQEQWERSLQLWHRFGEAELKVDAMAFTTAIQACAHAKLWRHALGLLEDMHREDLNPGAIPTSVAISACNGVSEWEVAVELFRSARESREAMDSIIYNAAMQSCGEGGLWKEAIRLFQHLEADLTMAPTAQSYGALMTAMHKSGKWQKGFVAFTAMKEAMARSLKVDVLGFSAAVNVAEAAKKWPLAVHLLMQEMPEHKIAPDTLSFNSAISAAERSRKWRVAIALLQEMKDLDVARDVESYAGAILACVAGKQWSRGLNLLDLMASDDLGADAQSYGVLLSECEQRSTGSELAESALLTALAERGAGVSSSSRQPRYAAPSSDEAASGTKAPPSTAPTAPRRREAEDFKPMPCTSAMNVRRVKGRAVPGHTPGRLAPLVDAPLPTMPAPGPLRAPKIFVRAGQPYAKELRLLQHVMQKAPQGDPAAICEAIENFGDEILVRGKARLWLKIAGGIKTDVLTAAIKGGPLTSGDLQCSVLEIGAYCGYSSTRMALALPGVHIASMEVDPVHMIIARNVVLHGGLAGTIDVWTGHSKDLLPRILKRYGGELKFGAVFMDQKGSRYQEDMLKMESENLLHPGAVVVADNVLKPGAPLFLYQIMNGGRYNAQIVSLDEFAMPSEDWMSINVKKLNAPQNDTEPPEDLHQLSKETDRMRERAVGPGRSVTYEEWAEFAQDVKTRLARTNVTLTVDLRPESSRDRDDLFSAKSK